MIKKATIEAYSQAEKYYNQQITYDAYIWWSMKHLLLTGLPYRKPNYITHIRNNGNTIITITGSEKYGLPYGQDRIILHYLISAYIYQKPKNYTLRLRSFQDILYALNFGNNGKDYKYLKDGLKRLSKTTIDIDSKDEKSLRGYRIIKNYEDLEKRQKPFEPWDIELKFDQDFVQVFNKNKIPISIRDLILLKNDPLCFDLYLFEVYRSFHNDCIIPIFDGDMAYINAMGTTSKDKFKIRTALIKAQEKIYKIWPTCKCYIENDKIFIKKSVRLISQNNKIPDPNYHPYIIPGAKYTQ